MADMLKLFVEQELENLIKTKYTHIRYPFAVYAEVTQVAQEGEAYVCSVKILNKNKQYDKKFPEIPKVRTKLEVKKGDIVVTVLLYGECDPYIIGRNE